MLPCGPLPASQTHQEHVWNHSPSAASSIDQVHLPSHVVWGWPLHGPYFRVGSGPLSIPSEGLERPSHHSSLPPGSHWGLVLSPPPRWVGPQGRVQGWRGHGLCPGESVGAIPPIPEAEATHLGCRTRMG